MDTIVNQGYVNRIITLIFENHHYLSDVSKLQIEGLYAQLSNTNSEEIYISIADVVARNSLQIKKDFDSEWMKSCGMFFIGSAGIAGLGWLGEYYLPKYNYLFQRMMNIGGIGMLFSIVGILATGH